VIITGAIIYALSLLTEMSVFVTNIASMIGIGVAVDYSLFVLVRYREEIAAGQTPERARATAMSTSGRAVVLAGFTVIASLAALFLIPSNGIRSMATGAIIVVAISVLAAATLLPVVIGMLGSRPYEIGRIGRLLQRLRISRRRAPMRQGFWQRWSAAVMRHPVVALLAATTFMLLLAAPALDLKVRNSASTQLNRGNEVTRASSEVAQLLGPGALGPVWVLLESRRGPTGPHAEQTVLRVAQTLASDPLVARVIAAQPSRNRRAVVLEATLRVNPESQRAFSAIERLRKRLPASAGSGVIVRVGGTTAELLDFDRLVTVSLWRPVLFVLLLSFVILLILLRSVVLPLKAMLMNSLSVAAAYGALVAVFQFGWLGFLGLHKASSIYPITLPLVIVVAFGLSMDYHVFLLSRIRERYFATGDSDRAVSEALASSATPITSAALIMVAVFLSFVGAGVPSVEQLGFAAAVAITVDATIVRLVIVPAAMKLLGRWNWWLPHALDSRLPGGLGRTVPRIGVPRGSELAGSELAVSTLSASSGD
jgi:RND superfamily putative drug exporter